MIDENINEINKLNNKLKFIEKSAQLAAVLEVSSLKPGNINPFYNFENTKYEHFLAGSMSLGSVIYDVAISGCKNKSKNKNKINIGEYILQGVSGVKKSHSGGNTHLGILMLFVPIASGCGVCISKGDYGFRNLQKNINRVLGSTTVDDAVNLCNAIKLADAGGLGEINEFDLNDKNLREKLIKHDLNFYNLLKVSAERDRIAEELTTGMNITFEYARVIREIHDKTGDIFSAVVQTHIAILSKFPDTLIARKCGFEKAEVVSEMASEVLKEKNKLVNFDKYLRKEGNTLNPGTTADLVAASLFVALLNGLEI